MMMIASSRSNAFRPMQFITFGEASQANEAHVALSETVGDWRENNEKKLGRESNRLGKAKRVRMRIKSWLVKRVTVFVKSIESTEKMANISIWKMLCSFLVALCLLMNECVSLDDTLHIDRSRHAVQTINESNKYCKCSMQMDVSIGTIHFTRLPMPIAKAQNEKLFVRCKFQYVIAHSH